ncbi:MAG: hypothetical protein ABR603_11025 [Pyrinomonadaceae bacterium]
MAGPCQNCGAEFYEGQQFCRRCGTPLSAASGAGGEAPTQLFPQQGRPAQGPAVAATRVRGETGPVAAGQPTAYYPLANPQHTSPLVGQPFGSRPLAVEPDAPRRRRRGGWLAALLVVFVLGAGLASGAAYVLWRATRGPVVARRSNTGGVTAVPKMPAAPDAPRGVGESIKEALRNNGIPLPLDESGAVVSGDTTTLTRTYELDVDGAFAVHAVTGSVTVAGGDGDGVVVRVVKRGGSAAERVGARVLEAKNEEGVMLLTAAAPSAAVSVSYEVSVPRHMRELKIEVERGDVRVSGFAGAVVADVKTGGLEFRDVSGEVRSKLIKGDTKIFGAGAEREGSQQFSVVKGNIEATLAEGFGADLKAEVLDGDIEAAEAFGLRVVKASAGRHVAGRIGEGGEALVFKVTDGRIRLKK